MFISLQWRTLNGVSELCSAFLLNTWFIFCNSALILFIFSHKLKTTPDDTNNALAIFFMFLHLTDIIFARNSHAQFLLLFIWDWFQIALFCQVDSARLQSGCQKECKHDCRTQERNVGFSQCYATHLRRCVDLNAAFKDSKASMWQCRHLHWKLTSLLCLHSTLTANSSLSFLTEWRTSAQGPEVNDILLPQNRDLLDDNLGQVPSKSRRPYLYIFHILLFYL